MPAFVRWMFYICLFKCSIFLWTSCLVVLFIIERGVLKCLSMIVQLPISPFNFVSVCFIYWGALIGTYILYIFYFIIGTYLL